VHGYLEHLTWHKVAPQLAEQFSVVVPDLRGYRDSAKPQTENGTKTIHFAPWRRTRSMLMGHYGHESFLVVAHDRGARVTHRLQPGNENK
jgi:haloacetate dehalogenase